MTSKSELEDELEKELEKLKEIKKLEEQSKNSSSAFVDLDKKLNFLLDEVFQLFVSELTRSSSISSRMDT